MQWKKSLRWGNFNLYWARPLKSILGIFDEKSLTLISSSDLIQIQLLLIRNLKIKKKYLKASKNIKLFSINLE